MTEILNQVRAKAAPYVALAQFALALVLMALVLLTVLRLAGFALVAFPQIDHTRLAYACGSFWAVTRAWS